MGKLLVKDKDVVVPGDVLAEGMDYLPSYGTYRKDDKILANRLGLVAVDGKVLKTIQMKGRYAPRRNDVVIAKVFDILMHGWRMDINSAYSAVLMLQEASFKFIQKGADLSKIIALDDWCVVKITKVSTQNLVDVTMKGPGLRKLDGGRLITVNPHKVPRIIGKQGSMVSMVKDYTGCRIVVGQNGRVWIQGEPEQEHLAVKTIQKIAEESHKSGLTDEIRAYLEENKLPGYPKQQSEKEDFENSEDKPKKFQRDNRSNDGSNDESNDESNDDDANQSNDDFDDSDDQSNESDDSDKKASKKPKSEEKGE